MMEKELISRLVPVLLRDRKSLMLLVGVSIAGGVVEIVGAGSIYPFLKLIASPEYIHENVYLWAIYNYWGFSSERMFVAMIGVVSLVLVVGANAFMFLRSVMAVKYTAKKMSEISRRALSSYVCKSQEYFHSHTYGDVTKTVCDLTDKFVHNVLFSAINIFADGIVLVALSLMLLRVESLVASLVILSAIIVIHGVLSSTKKNLIKYGTESDRTNGERFNQVLTIARGMKEIKVYNKEDYFINLFGGLIEKLAGLHVKLAILQMAGPIVLQSVLSVALLLLAIGLVVSGRPFNEILPMMTMIGVIGVRVIAPLNRLTSSITNMRQHCHSCAALINLLEENPVLGNHLRVKSSANTVLVLCEMKNVRFSYKAGGVEVFSIKNLNLSLKQGLLIGLAGPSGGGKTTIAEILSGLIKPDHGSVQIEAGIDAAESQLKGLIAYVPSSVFLFNGSIRENIAFGVPNGRIDSSRVNYAVRLADLSGLVSSLPSQLDTCIGNDGGKLSAGQRQRIGIARALYHGAKILILDEVTSSLDSLTEKNIIQTLKGLTDEVLIIAIAHSRNFILACDRVIMVRNGAVIEDGAPQDLVRNSAEFSSFLSLTDNHGKTQ